MARTDRAAAAADEARRTARAKVRKWSRTRERLFFEELAATCNIAHSARVAGMSETSARRRKQNDPAFAEAWRRALDAGYAELEEMLLRHSLEGAERIEQTVGDDGAVRQTRTVRSFPHDMAMRLLVQHRGQVERYRVMAAAQAGDDPDAAARIRSEMDRVRERLAEARERG